MPARIESTRLVAKNSAARMAVVRVSTFAVPRLVRKPPPEPMPRPPPSERCSSTTPIMADTMIRWMMMMNVCMANPTGDCCAESAPARLRYRCRAALYTIRCGISTGTGSSPHERSDMRGPAYRPLRGLMRATSPISRCNAEKFVGLQARPADQCAVHIGKRQQLPRVARLDRAAVEHAHPLPGRAEARGEALANEPMHLDHVSLGR